MVSFHLPGTHLLGPTRMFVVIGDGFSSPRRVFGPPLTSGAVLSTAGFLSTLACLCSWNAQIHSRLSFRPKETATTIRKCSRS
ncbi:hypothetical protein BDV98DRAFT_225468 [Pterulicium gracile]|uniref:Uncharacterized protein n=1 Tax=Pterulicium gracile TaxID=1884261 RepID=A0A5C3R3Y2_9AGAR|nr:hypothetical protein BDV98DRAFT_225468 [Pterula gracilis]